MAVQVKNSTFQINHLLPTKHSNSVTLNWTAVAHSQQPAIIRSVIRIRHWTAETIVVVNLPLEIKEVVFVLYLFATGIGLFGLQLFVHGLKTWSLDNIFIKLVA